jgi:excisionase family DNA binding protein
MFSTVTSLDDSDFEDRLCPDVASNLRSSERRFNLADAAEYLGISQRHLKDLCREGRIVFTKPHYREAQIAQVPFYTDIVSRWSSIGSEVLDGIYLKIEMNTPLINSPEPYLASQELAEMLRTSKPTVSKWVRAGCPHLELSQAYRFRLSEVTAWLKEQKENPSNPCLPKK